MLRVLPDWYGEAQKKIDNCVDDIIRKNNIDLAFAYDSNSIKESKEMILMALLRIYESVNIGERERIENFEKDIKKYKK